MACANPDKPRHKTKTGAQKAIQVIEERKGITGLYVYPCGSHWHVGNVLAKESRNQARRTLLNAQRKRRRGHEW